MKWIGQNIYDLVSRFRNDVYLEDISSGTIASGAHLGLDSNNKIVKATDGGGDLTSIVAGTGLSGTDLTGPIPTLNVDASQPNITTLAGVSAIGTAGTPITITSDTVTFTSANADDPLIKILNTTDNDQGARLFLWKERTDSSIQGGEAGDEIGALYFYGYDNGSNLQGYGKIETFIDVATHGQESGIMQLGVASHDGGFNNGLYMQGGSVDTEVDVKIGTGAASVTTIAGTLTMGTTAAMTNAGLLSVASQSNITTLAGVTAIGTASNDLDITNDLVRFNSANANDPLVLIKNTANDATSGRLRFLNERGADGQDDDETGIIEFFSYDDGTPAGERYARIIGTIHDASATEESGKLSLQVASHDGGDEDGLVLTGGSVDAEVDVTIGNGAASVVTVPGNITVTGTITGDVTGDLTGRADTVATIAGLAPNTATTQATQGNITTCSSLVSIGTITTGVWNGTKITDVYTNSSGKRYGNTIKILPSDFMINDDAASPLSFKDGSNSGVHVNDTANEAIAFVTIPEGMKATHIDIYATHTRAISVYEVDLNASFDFTATADETGNCNTQITVDPNINATATNYLAIIIALNNAVHRIHGGQVTIAAQ